MMDGQGGQQAPSASPYSPAHPASAWNPKPRTVHGTREHPPLGFVHLLGLTSFTFVRSGGQLFLVCYLGLAFLP